MHDHPHHHGHGHDHHGGDDRHHDHRHSHAGHHHRQHVISTTHAVMGHNHAHQPEHMHSHLHGDGGRERVEEVQALCAAFIDGFRNAGDKNSYLRIAGIAFTRPGDDGLAMHLVDAAIVSVWQIGTASPAFASRELVYLAYPGKMIAMRETMTFTYVSIAARADIDLRDIVSTRKLPS